MTKIHDLTASQLSSLANFCMTAATQYGEYAEYFKKMSDAPPGSSNNVNKFLAFNRETASDMSDQFARQHEEARAFAEMLMNADSARITVPDDTTEDDA